MTLEERIAAMQEFCERQDFEFNTWRGTQREPGEGVSIRFGQSLRAPMIRIESHDGLDVAVGRMEAALLSLKRAGSDAYLHEPHRQMGAL